MIVGEHSELQSSVATMRSGYTRRWFGSQSRDSRLRWISGAEQFGSARCHRSGTAPNSKRQARCTVQVRSRHVAPFGTATWRCPPLGSSKVFSNCQYERTGPTRCGHVARQRTGRQPRGRSMIWLASRQVSGGRWHHPGTRTARVPSWPPKQGTSLKYHSDKP